MNSDRIITHSLKKATRTMAKKKEVKLGRMPSKAKRIAIVDSIVPIFRKTMPEPHCELFHKNPYQLLVSVVLSAQTTDKMVNRCMEPLYKEGLTPETVLKWGREKLLSKIKSIGLAPTKSKNVITLTERILEDHAGEVPNDRKYLESLPGVGRKTANVVLGEIYREPTLAVDTHVYRVGLRLRLHNESTPNKAEFALLDVINDKYLPTLHHWLVLHGRYVCKSQSPDCEACAIKNHCLSYGKFNS